MDGPYDGLTGLALIAAIEADARRALDQWWDEWCDQRLATLDAEFADTSQEPQP